MNRGHCKHGEFILMEGCPDCIQEERERRELEGEGETTLLETAEAETALELRPGEDVEVLSYFQEGLKILEYAKTRVIATAEDNKTATDDLSVMSKLKKAMEAKRKEYLDPLKEQTQAIRDTYDYLMSPILQADKLTRNKMMTYRQEQDRKRQEQEEINRLRIEAAKKEAALSGTGEITESLNLLEVAPEVTQVSTELGTAGQRDNWKYEVIDLDALPREYMIPDTAMLNAIAKKHHDRKEIPGVRFYNEPIITVRAR